MTKSEIIHKICHLTFSNGTSVNVALIAYNPESMKESVWIERTFEEMLAEAKNYLTENEVSCRRGPLKSFSIGEWIRVKQN